MIETISYVYPIFHKKKPETTRPVILGPSTRPSTGSGQLRAIRRLESDDIWPIGHERAKGAPI